MAGERALSRKPHVTGVLASWTPKQKNLAMATMNTFYMDSKSLEYEDVCFGM